MPAMNAPHCDDTPSHRVLIIDRSKDSRNVFRTALERRGLEILEASEFRSGLDAIRRFHPQVVVMDVESIGTSGPAVREALNRELSQTPSRLVVLGNVAHQGPPHSHFVSKPYHYGPVIRTIEHLAAAQQ